MSKPKVTKETIRIRRAPRGAENPYFPTMRKTAQDRTISLEARGLLWELLSRPDDWQIRLSQLQQKGAGRDRIRRIVKELMDSRYIVREETRTEQGHIHYTYDIYEQPLTENPSTVNPHLHNKDKQNIDANASTAPQADAVSAPPEQNLPTCPHCHKPMTLSALVAGRWVCDPCLVTLEPGEVVHPLASGGISTEPAGTALARVANGNGKPTTVRLSPCCNAPIRRQFSMGVEWTYCSKCQKTPAEWDTPPAPKPPTPLFLLADAIAQAQWGKPVTELRKLDREEKAFPVAKNFLNGGCTVEDVALVNEWQAQSGLDGMKNGHPNWMWSHLETARAWKRGQAQRVKPSGKIVI